MSNRLTFAKNVHLPSTFCGQDVDKVSIIMDFSYISSSFWYKNCVQYYHIVLFTKIQQTLPVSFIFQSPYLPTVFEYNHFTFQHWTLALRLYYPYPWSLLLLLLSSCIFLPPHHLHARRWKNTCLITRTVGLLAVPTIIILSLMWYLFNTFFAHLFLIINVIQFFSLYFPSTMCYSKVSGWQPVLPYSWFCWILASEFHY